MKHCRMGIPYANGGVAVHCGLVIPQCDPQRGGGGGGGGSGFYLKVPKILRNFATLFFSILLYE